MGNGHPVAAVICTPEVDASFAKSGVCYFNTVRLDLLWQLGRFLAIVGLKYLIRSRYFIATSVSCLVSNPPCQCTSAMVGRYCSRDLFSLSFQFGGNPVSMAAAMAVMSEIEDKKLMDKCVKTGQYLKQKLEDLKQKHIVIGKCLCMVQFSVKNLNIGPVNSHEK